MRRKRKIHLEAVGGELRHTVICGKFKNDELKKIHDIDVSYIEGRGGIVDYEVNGKVFSALYIKHAQIGYCSIFMIQNGRIRDFRSMFRHNLYSYLKIAPLIRELNYSMKDMVEMFGDYLLYYGSEVFRKEDS